MARTVEIPVKIGLDNAWVVSPGDKLVLGFACPLNMAEAATIKERVAAVLPDVELVIIADVTHMAVYKPEASGLIRDAERRKQDRVNGRHT